MRLITCLILFLFIQSIRAFFPFFGGNKKNDIQEVEVDAQSGVSSSFSIEDTFVLNIEQKDVLHPAVKDLDEEWQTDTSMSAKYRCLYPGKLDMWYDDHRGGSFQGRINLGQTTTTNTYEGHEFFYTVQGDPQRNEVARLKMNKDQVLYVIEDKEKSAPEPLRLETERELQFMEEYYNRTGIHWRHYYGPKGPRPPPQQYMWPADQLGQVHGINVTRGFWHCNGHNKNCQSNETIPLKLEVISLAPRAFIIENFISHFEADEIIRQSAAKLKHSSVGDSSTTGGFESSTRTSTNAWISRHASDILDTLYGRAAQLLRLEDSYITDNAEQLQVVHYVDGQKYDAHHDWGVSGYPESRYITLLMYLTDMASPRAGGETAFPKGANGRGIKVHPGKGSAVLFYNLLPDGNGDDLALHAALPVREGEKWLANFWVWDPKMK